MLQAQSEVVKAESSNNEEDEDDAEDETVKEDILVTINEKTAAMAQVRTEIVPKQQNDKTAEFSSKRSSVPIR